MYKKSQTLVRAPGIWPTGLEAGHGPVYTVIMAHPLPLAPDARIAPDWRAGAFAGFAGATMLMAAELAWTSATDEAGPWRIAQLVAALVLGSDVAAPDVSPAFDPLVAGAALLVHFGLGLVFGLLLAWVETRAFLQQEWSNAFWVGLIFGGALYVLDFHAMVALFPWFGELRGLPTLIAQLGFGVVTALLYRQLAREPAEFPR
ncbi:Sodium:proline symporter OS=Rhizobacter sp. Root404 OX=1736528 GN=ASC76_05615 PE=4 SV=1 [Rhizobacter fulvus]